MYGSDYPYPDSFITERPATISRRLQTLRLVFFITWTISVGLTTGCREALRDGNNAADRIIVTSDTILSGMVLSLLPPGHSDVTAIMPPEQCPGHYDMKLSDIQRVEEADLIVSFRDLAFMESAGSDPSRCILLDRHGRNWMTPDSYVSGLEKLAETLAARFPEAAEEIMDRRDRTVQDVSDRAAVLRNEIRRAGIMDKAVIASSMQREPLEWMGLRIIGDFGRPESISVREVARLSKVGELAQVVMIVDNLQSGPDAGLGIAEALGVPHVVLSNFPSTDGYLATLDGNVKAVLKAAGSK